MQKHEDKFFWGVLKSRDFFGNKTNSDFFGYVKPWLDSLSLKKLCNLCGCKTNGEKEDRGTNGDVGIEGKTVV